MATNKVDNNKEYGEITTIKTIRLTVVNKVPKDETKAVAEADKSMAELMEAIKKLGVDDIETINEKYFINLDNKADTK